MLFLHNKE